MEKDVRQAEATGAPKAAAPSAAAGALDYPLLARSLASLAEGEPHWLPTLANASALLWERLPRLNWAGFYLIDDRGDLLLGPFQGSLACVRIKLGSGVCGTAAAEDRTLRVPDVHRFAGHIACDAASNSEIVVPLHDGAGAVVGVLDLDSPILDRFSPDDQAGLELFCRTLERCCRLSSLPRA
ncbi:MAG: GAF domain-containing protein [Atopobiaceae bacterium]|nr:GAF domain-containing protein [Atopobiaceae bacterium]